MKFNLLLLIGSFAFAQETTKVHLFDISKSSNLNRTVYEAIITSDCKFGLTNPINIYWHDKSKNGVENVHGLNNRDQKLLYMDYAEITDTHLVATIRGLKNKNVELPLTIETNLNGQNCSVSVSGAGLTHITDVYLSEFKWWQPHKVTVSGTNEKGSPDTVSFQID